MTNRDFGKYLLTFVLAAQAVMGFALDWSANHLLNPGWSRTRASTAPCCCSFWPASPEPGSGCCGENRRSRKWASRLLP